MKSHCTISERVKLYKNIGKHCSSKTFSQIQIFGLAVTPKQLQQQKRKGYRLVCCDMQFYTYELTNYDPRSFWSDTVIDV